MSSGRMGDDASWLFWQNLGFCQGYRLISSAFFYVCLFQASNTIYFPCFSVSIRPHITEEQEDLIRRVTEIPLDQRKYRDHITLDTLHAYSGDPMPTSEARCLNNYFCSHKLPILSLLIFSSACLMPSLVLILICVFVEMVVAKLRVQIRTTAAHKKEGGRPRRGCLRQLLRSLAKGRRKEKLIGMTTAFPRRCSQLQGRSFLRSRRLPSIGQAKDWWRRLTLSPREQTIVFSHIRTMPSRW